MPGVEGRVHDETRRDGAGRPAEARRAVTRQGVATACLAWFSILPSSPSSLSSPSSWSFGFYSPAIATPLETFRHEDRQGRLGEGDAGEQKRCSAYVLCTVSPDRARNSRSGAEAKRPKHKVKSGRENVNKNTPSGEEIPQKTVESIRTFRTVDDRSVRFPFFKTILLGPFFWILAAQKVDAAHPAKAYWTIATGRVSIGIGLLLRSSSGRRETGWSSDLRLKSSQGFLANKNHSRWTFFPRFNFEGFFFCSESSYAYGGCCSLSSSPSSSSVASHNRRHLFSERYCFVSGERGRQTGRSEDVIQG